MDDLDEENQFVGPRSAQFEFLFNQQNEDVSALQGSPYGKKNKKSKAEAKEELKFQGADQFIQDLSGGCIDQDALDARKKAKL